MKKIPDAKLVIVGDGPSKQSLIDEALSAGLDKNVDFKGVVSDDEKIKLLYESRVLLNPSLVEGFGLVILEAFSCSKPVIVSDTRPLSDLVSDTNDGFVLSASDSNQWANKLVELISNPALCEKMGKAGQKKVVTQYSLEKIIDSVIDLYDTVRRQKILNLAVEKHIIALLLVSALFDGTSNMAHRHSCIRKNHPCRRS